MAVIFSSLVVSTLRRLRKLFGAVRLHGLSIGLKSSILKVPSVGKFWHARNYRCLAMINVMEHKMYVDLSDPGISWQLLTRGHREVQHVNDIRAYVRPGMTGIDIGANIGFFPLIEAALIGSNGRLYCIEPVSRNVEILKKNISENEYLDRVEMFQYAIAAENGVSRILLTNASNSHHIVPDDKADFSNMNFEEVEAISIDRFMDMVGLSSEDVDFLRCDIEGYEAIAIRGMTKLLTAETPMHFFIELHPDTYPEWDRTVEQIVGELLEYGFTFRSVVKEFPRTDGKEPRVEVLRNPSIEDYLRHQGNWGNGGVQVHLQRK